MRKFEDESIISNIKKNPRDQNPGSDHDINSSFWEEKDQRESDSLSISYKPRQNIIIQNMQKEETSGHFCFIKEKA